MPHEYRGFAILADSVQMGVIYLFRPLKAESTGSIPVSATIIPRNAYTPLKIPAFVWTTNPYFEISPTRSQGAFSSTSHFAAS